MSKPKRIIAGVFAALLILATAWVQKPIDEMRPQFQERGSVTGGGAMTNMLIDQSLQFFGAAAMGLRQAVAGMLWVKADDFFHRGEYDSIIPLVRMVTWLDPHQIDVYSTGAWHLDYNFVDPDQRSDKRYIPPAIKLMEEGIQNNSEVYDLYFDLAWTHYFQKIKDYNKSIEWLEKAETKPGTDPNTGEIVTQPAFVGRMLAHSYEKAGYYDKAEAQWRKCLVEAEAAEKKDPKSSLGVSEASISRRNLALMLLRRAWREGDMAAYGRGLEMFKSIKDADPRQKIAVAAAEKNYAELKAKGKVPNDTLPPVDVQFDATWKKVSSKILLVEGTFKLGNAEDYKGLTSECFTSWYGDNQKLPANRREVWRGGCRVRIALTDIDCDFRNIKTPDSVNWDIDKTQTELLDDTMVHNGKFRLKIDMTKDSVMYPLAKDKYKLTIWFDPNDAPDFIQDRIGWKGEGMTDKRYLNTTAKPGFRLIQKEFILKKSDII